MPDWGIWLIVAAALAAGEIMIFTGFILGPLAVAAVVVAVVAAFDASTQIQLGVFAGASVLMLVVLRPIALRQMSEVPPSPTGAAALIGKPARVVDPIGDEGLGLIRLENENWTARLAPGESPIEAGARVIVREIGGATAVVARAPDNE